MTQAQSINDEAVILPDVDPTSLHQNIDQKLSDLSVLLENLEAGGRLEFTK